MGLEDQVWQMQWKRNIFIVMKMEPKRNETFSHSIMQYSRDSQRRRILLVNIAYTNLEKNVHMDRIWVINVHIDLLDMTIRWLVVAITIHLSPILKLVVEELWKDGLCDGMKSILMVRTNCVCNRP